MLLRINYLVFFSPRFATRLALLASCCFFYAADSQGQSPRAYEVNFTTNNIVADGIISPGEYDGATVSGNWNELRTPFSDTDTDNHRFQMLWDETNLYFLWQTDFTGFADQLPGDPSPNLDFGVPSLNLYFDPNTNGTENNVSDGEVSGYQIAFNNFYSVPAEGVPIVTTNDDRNAIGLFTEAHYNNAFGNQANWVEEGSVGVEGHGFGQGSGITLAQNNRTSGPNAGGIAELIIPWDALDADAEADDVGGPVPTGLNHVTAPTDGDEWFFNAGFIGEGGSNFLPIWSWTEAQPFASHGNVGHGVLTFKGEAGLPGDADGDGDVDGADFLAFQRDNPAGIAEWEANYGNTNAGVAATSSVPEPTSIALALAALTFTLAGSRRR